MTVGKNHFARFGRYSGNQGLADGLQCLRRLFQVVAKNLHAGMRGTLALHAQKQPRKHQQAKPDALCLAEQSAITHRFHARLAVKAAERFLRLRAMNRRWGPGSRAQWLLCGT